MLLINILEQLALFLPLCVGVYISFHVLRLTDLTTDGTFVLGAGVFSHLVVMGVGTTPAFLIAVLGGVCVGAFVALIQKNNAIDSLIAGVLVLFILQGLNLVLMGRPNISLLSVSVYPASVLAAISVCIVLGITILLQSSAGLLFRGGGENEHLLQRFGYSSHLLKTLGLMTSNGLAAVSGILSAQAFGYADLSMGMGVTLTGIGALTMGLFIARNLKCNRSFLVVRDILGIIAGVFVYFALFNTFLTVGVDPVYLKITMGGLLIAFLRMRLFSKGGQ
jgi:putative tryptophan/tyrosine transport system permease protein